MRPNDHTPVGYCYDHRCQRKFYRDRKSARADARARFPAEHMVAYRCFFTGQWHIGHLDPKVIRGRYDRDTLYGYRRRQQA